MPLYQVLSRPDPAALYSGESGAVFVADKFSWGAVLVTPIWAMMHGLWVELVIWVAAVVLLCLSETLIGAEAVFWIYIFSAIWIGFEAANIRASSLKRNGYAPIGDIIAMAPEMAEMEYLKRGNAT